MECMCIENDYGNINFKLGQIYQCIENVGIQQPFLVCCKMKNCFQMEIGDRYL